jgi:ATP-dependent RNA helicase HelY
MVCDRGNFAEYWQLLERARHLRERDRSERERDRSEAVRRAVADLRPGDVVFVPKARRRGLAVVVTSRDGRPTALTSDRRFFRMSARDFEDPPTALTQVPLPRSGNIRSARYRRDLAGKLATLRVKPPRRSGQRVSARVERKARELEREAEQHPVRSCPELSVHLRWAERARDAERRIKGVERRIQVRTETLARQFDRVLGVLADLGYVEGWGVTAKGASLARIYGEGDVLIAEAIEKNLFSGLSAGESAALVSTVVYEARERSALPPELPSKALVERYGALQRIWRAVRRTEDSHQVHLVRDLEPGFAGPVLRWAQGTSLEELLEDTEMAPGDFVRNCKQLVDLLRQIEDVAGPELRELMRAARQAVSRGVVAYSGL